MEDCYKYFLFGVLFLCVAGCGTRKLPETAVREAGAAERVEGDSLRLERRAAEWAKRRVEVRRVEWTGPDSLSRQFVHSVTRVVAGEESGGETVSYLQADRSAVATSGVERETIHVEQAGKGNKRGIPFVAGIVAWIACVGIAWRFFFLKV